MSDEWRKEWRAKKRAEDPEYFAKQQRAWSQKNPEKAAEYARRYREKNPGKNKQHYWNLKQEVMDAYGGKCICCGESTIQFLTIDHVNDDGADHREMLGHRRNAAGKTMYEWLKREGFPQGDFQVLCANCNMAKRSGICPHHTRKG